MPKILLMLSLVITQVLGDLGLSRGMKEFGAVNLQQRDIVRLILEHLVSNAWIWVGVAILVFSSLLYLVAVSHFDLSYVLPIHAFSYVLNALMAWLILAEQIPLLRWLSTMIITLGVFLVGTSDRSSSHPPTTNVWWWFPIGLTLNRNWIAIFTLCLGDAIGDLCLALGMKKIGAVNKLSLNLIISMITNPLIIVGIFGQTLAFANFILLLSWEDISFVRPASALTYIFSMLGAKLVLKEVIAGQKLMGISLIGIGVYLNS